MTSGVLIVDDDEAFRGLARRILQDAGLVILGEASTIAAALVSIDALRPASVLLDIGLPDGDGLELAGRLTLLPWSPSVVLVSTDPDAVSDADVRRSRARGFVAKADLPGAALAALFAIP